MQMRQRLVVCLAFVLAQAQERPARRHLRIEDCEPAQGHTSLFITVLVIKHCAEIPPALLPSGAQPYGFAIQLHRLLQPLMLTRLSSLLGNLGKALGSSGEGTFLRFGKKQQKK